MEEQKALWKVLDSEEIFERGYFKMRRDRCELPDGRIMPEYYVMEFSSWVHTVAVTKEGLMILAYQYRHAAADRFLELPGGASEPLKGESLEVSALRELREETGYSSKSIKLIGFHFPNPALQSNRLFTYLALQSELQGPQDLDAYEEIEVVKMPVKEVYEKLDKGEIKHSLMFPSLVLARPYLKEFF